jgi:hypothetical protein
MEQSARRKLKGPHNIEIELRHNKKKVLVHTNCLKPYFVLDNTNIEMVPDQALPNPGSPPIHTSKKRSQKTGNRHKFFQSLTKPGFYQKQITLLHNLSRHQPEPHCQDPHSDLIQHHHIPQLHQTTWMMMHPLKIHD